MIVVRCTRCETLTALGCTGSLASRVDGGLWSKELHKFRCSHLTSATSRALLIAHPFVPIARRPPAPSVAAFFTPQAWRTLGSDWVRPHQVDCRSREPFELIWTSTCIHNVTSKVSFVFARSILTSLRRRMNVASHEARLRTGLRPVRSFADRVTVYRRNFELIGRARHVTVYRYRDTRDPRVCLYCGVCTV